MAVTYVYPLTPADVEWINAWNADLERANVVVEFHNNQFYTIALGLDSNTGAFGQVLEYLVSQGVQKKLFEVAV